ncbi:MAG TPA: hypothetical protein VE869_15260 [Gemmatimonas sp.]|nr:hypothetical protein [Gemmatimonas sp.]
MIGRFQIEPAWLSESVQAVVIATAWMALGLAFLRRTAFVEFSLFVLGAACAWFLARGMMHSVSPYYGLVPYVAACVGGGVTWMAWGTRTLRERGMAALTMLGCIAFSGVPLLSPPLGAVRSFETATGRRERAALAWAGAGSSRALYLRTDGAVSLDTLIEGRLDRDGSGPQPVTLRRIRGAGEARTICEGITNLAQSMIRNELASGTTPSFLIRLPVRWPDCLEGALWRVTDP